jgi:hypothetical protein
MSASQHGITYTIAMKKWLGAFAKYQQQGKK